MAVKKVAYKEPKSYFSPTALKVAKEFDKQEAQKQKEAQKNASKKK